MTSPVMLKTLTAAAVLLSLSACGSSSSSSSSDETLSSQAVDGYIVGADVFCDDTASGVTRAAGRFDCPVDTQISRISGGFDVGVDEEATSGTIAFTGVLTGLAGEEFITPITTLLLAMTRDGQSEDFVPDAATYRTVQDALIQTLGLSEESLTANPAVDLEAAQSNAQVHQILAAFAPNINGYEESTAAFARVVLANASRGGGISLTQDVGDTLVAINGELEASGSSLQLATGDLEQATSNVLTANTAIGNVDSPARVSTEAQRALIEDAPVTIDRREAVVNLTNEEEDQSQTLSIELFENPQRTNGLYFARLFSGMTRVSYDNEVFQFNQSIDDARITVAFELEAVDADDERKISFVSDDVVVSATKDQPESLVISMFSADSTFQVVGTDSAGVTTNAVIDTDGETISSDGDNFTVNLERINTQLADLGFEDILATSGNYTVTLVVSGLRINEVQGDRTTEAEVLSVDTGAGVVTGNGFRGYVSIIR